MGQHRAGTEIATLGNRHLGDVAGREVQVLRLTFTDQQRPLQAGLTQEVGNHLGRWSLERIEAFDGEDGVLFQAVAQRRHQSHTALADGQLVGVIARLDVVRVTAANPLRTTGRALSGAAGAFLFPGLLAATGHEGTRLGRMSALALAGEMGNEGFFEQAATNSLVEEICVNGELAGFDAFRVIDWDLNWSSHGSGLSSA